MSPREERGLDSNILAMFSKSVHGEETVSSIRMFGFFFFFAPSSTDASKE